MPAKRVQVHTSCVGCGQPVPLGHLATSVRCAACSWSGAVPADEWRWVFEADDCTVADGRLVLGESRASAVECSACQAPIDDAVIRRALRASSSAVPCTRCAAPMPLRRVPGELALLATALVGEGDAKPAAPTHATSRVACANCGANIELDGSTPTPACAFCGAHTPIPPDVWKVLHPPGLVHPFYVWSTDALTHARPASVPTASSPLRVGRLIAWITIPTVLAALVPVIISLLALRGSSHVAPTFAAPGSPCDGAASACSLDHASLLECVDDKLVVGMACKGPKACRSTDHGKRVSCDYTLSVEGDPCNVRDQACSTDHRAQLRCDGSKFMLASTCHGHDGCTVHETNDGYMLACDDHIAPPNSPCVTDGDFACASDGKSLLRCTSGRFTVAATCKGPRGCRASPDPMTANTNVSCDGNIADVGDPCSPKDRACDSGGQASLACEDGKYQIAQRCTRGCVSDGSDGWVCRGTQKIR